MCQPGRPGPHGLGHAGSPGLAAFQSAKSSGSRFRSSDLDARAGEELVEVLAGELAVAGEPAHREVDVAVRPRRRCPCSTSAAISATISGMCSVTLGSSVGGQHAERRHVLVRNSAMYRSDTAVGSTFSAAPAG